MNLNSPQLGAAIEKAEGKARMRTVTVPQLKSFVSKLEKKLAAILFKTDWQGLKVRVDCHRNDNLNQINYKSGDEPTATVIYLKYSGTSWAILSIAREKQYHKSIFIENLEVKASALVKFLSKNLYKMEIK